MKVKQKDEKLLEEEKKEPTDPNETVEIKPKVKKKKKMAKSKKEVVDKSIGSSINLTSPV